MYNKHTTTLICYGCDRLIAMSDNDSADDMVSISKDSLQALVEEAEFTVEAFGHDDEWKETVGCDIQTAIDEAYDAME